MFTGFYGSNVFYDVYGHRKAVVTLPFALKSQKPIFLHCLSLYRNMEFGENSSIKSNPIVDVLKLFLEEF